jgi:hypothetical protein
VEKGKVTMRGKSTWELVSPNCQRIFAATVAVSELINALTEDLDWNKLLLLHKHSKKYAI